MIPILSDEEVELVQDIIEKHRAKKPPGTFSFKAQGWKKWRQKFGRYVNFIREQDPEIEDEHLIFLLMYLLGKPLWVAETFRILERNGWTTESGLQDTINRLSVHFRRVANANTYSRVNFHRRLQLPGETIADFIHAAEYLSRLCEFSMSYEIVMRDKVVVGVLDDAAREKMFEYDDLLTYEMALTIACNQEVRHARLHGG